MCFQVNVVSDDELPVSNYHDSESDSDGRFFQADSKPDTSSINVPLGSPATLKQDEVTKVIDFHDDKISNSLHEEQTLEQTLSSSAEMLRIHQKLAHIFILWYSTHGS